MPTGVDRCARSEHACMRPDRMRLPSAIIPTQRVTIHRPRPLHMAWAKAKPWTGRGQEFGWPTTETMPPALVTGVRFAVLDEPAPTALAALPRFPRTGPRAPDGRGPGSWRTPGAPTNCRGCRSGWSGPEWPERGGVAGAGRSGRSGAEWPEWGGVRLDLVAPGPGGRAHATSSSPATRPGCPWPWRAGSCPRPRRLSAPPGR
jgi:hypothetical protein